MNKFKDARSTGQKEENIMGKYEQDARRLLEYVGGKENIAAVSHCVSRMRFVLNDPAKADVAKIEARKRPAHILSLFIGSCRGSQRLSLCGGCV